MRAINIFESVRNFLNHLKNLCFLYLFGRVIFNIEEYKIMHEKYMNFDKPWFYYGSIDGLKFFILVMFIIYLFQIALYAFCKNYDKKNKPKHKVKKIKENFDEDYDYYFK